MVAAVGRLSRPADAQKNSKIGILWKSTWNNSACWRSWTSGTIELLRELEQLDQQIEAILAVWLADREARLKAAA